MAHPNDMNRRQLLLQAIAGQILDLANPLLLRVAVDGVDGAGKTVFADELAVFLAASGRQIIRAGVDSFHNPREVRYRLGATSPQGFFHDSYDYAVLKTALLRPLSPDGSRQFRRGAFDHRADAPLSLPLEPAEFNAILLFDGIFLHRPELVEFWDFSIFIEVSFEVSIPRGAARDGSSPDPWATSNRRYVEGQKIYLSQCRPRDLATVVVNNEVLEAPLVVR